MNICQVGNERWPYKKVKKNVLYKVWEVLYEWDTPSYSFMTHPHMHTPRHGAVCLCTVAPPTGSRTIRPGRVPLLLCSFASRGTLCHGISHELSERPWVSCQVPPESDKSKKSLSDLSLVCVHNSTTEEERKMVKAWGTLIGTLIVWMASVSNHESAAKRAINLPCFRYWLPSVALLSSRTWSSSLVCGLIIFHSGYLIVISLVLDFAARLYRMLLHKKRRWPIVQW